MHEETYYVRQATGILLSFEALLSPEESLYTWKTRDDMAIMVAGHRERVWASNCRCAMQNYCGERKTATFKVIF